jgi:hypothetical protein
MCTVTVILEISPLNKGAVAVFRAHFVVQRKESLGEKFMFQGAEEFQLLSMDLCRMLFGAEVEIYLMP